MLITNLAKLLYRTVVLKLQGRSADHTSDYNAVAETYDDYYSRYLGQEATAFMERLPLQSGMKVIDLACGTGFFSHYIARQIGESGYLTAVDLSSGMLARNRESAKAKGLSNIRFVEDDAIGFLRTMDDNAVDAVICGWGICYMDHARFRAEIERVVRPGGFVGIIENRACTLKSVSDLFRNVIVRHPGALVKDVSLNLPKDHRYLIKTLCKGSLKKLDAADGSVCVPCVTGSEVAEYMVRSGASAGFLDAIDKSKIDTVFGEFVKLADQMFQSGQALQVKHEYCTLIATKA
jgi:ubiquinone/menaquinone biosynthesis C-methylase UbiE